MFAMKMIQKVDAPCLGGARRKTTTSIKHGINTENILELIVGRGTREGPARITGSGQTDKYIS